MFRRFLNVRPVVRRSTAIAFLVLFGLLAAHSILVTAREGGTDHPGLTRWWRPWHHEIGKAG